MKKKTGWIILSCVGFVLLVGAVYLAPQLFQRTTAQNESKAGPAAGVGTRGDAPAETLLPNDELPQRDYDLGGTVSRVKDNSIFIEPAFMEGEAEIVVTQDTKIYMLAGRDVIQDGKDGSPLVYRYKLQPMTIDELVNNDILSIWAEKRGDRYIAEVIRVLR
jgi:hypothetical protein